jgi:peroxisomal membrane protein 4
MTPLSTDLLHLFTSLVSGMKYGAKIRLPHAVVMTVIFKRNRSAKEQVQAIYRAVFMHAWNLGELPPPPPQTHFMPST